MASFEEANRKVHRVEDEWHYPIMVRYGYRPMTLSTVGLVRAYDYDHPDGHQITVNTGVNSDYWSDRATHAGGLWSALEPFLRSRHG